jgi:hypothetical protein
MVLNEEKMIMNDCSRLFRADNIKAFYSTAHKALVLSADVTINPYSDHVRICRNPLERLLPAPAVHEYMVVGTTRPGIDPDLVVKRTISASFSMDATPAKVAVYSMGIDNPERVEVSVDTQAPAVSTPPPQANPPTQTSTAAQTSPAASGTPVEATGWSHDFVLQDALTNAVAELRTAAGFRNPDVGLHFEVVAMGGQVGGFTLHTGVFVKVKAG